jgi:glycine cleavage system regulatory protein
MLGRQAEVTQKLVENFPNIIIWHCSNHCLQPTVNDVMYDISAACHIKMFLTKLFTMHPMKIELVDCKLSFKLNSVAHMLVARWVASSTHYMRTV